MSKREYKSGVFSMLLEEPENALDTFNALNDSDYWDVSLIRIHKIGGKVLLSVRNDASFLIDSFFYLYEHQSTYNPNMPLRFLLYFSELIWDLIHEKNLDLFGRKQILIPTPKFIVFYNGLEERPDIEKFELADSYEHKCEEYDLKLSCIVYNINPGYNDELKKKSKVLCGYTVFVEKVRRYADEYDQLQDAINRAIDECIEEGILVDFFERKREVILEMEVLDMTFERREKLIARDSREEGRAEERINTERERARAEKAESHIELLEKQNRELIEMIEILKRQVSSQN